MPRASVIVTAKDEGETIVAYLDRLLTTVHSDVEVLVVFDDDQDTTAAPARGYASSDDRVVAVLNTDGHGPASAVRAGFARAASSTVVVTMADGSDDLGQIDELIALVEQGAVVAAASRYMPGGAQVGGPRFKQLLSRTAGLSLWSLGRIGVHDPTNAFKAYSHAFVDEVGIESDAGFESALELVVKAHRHGYPTAEIPTTWLDRESGESHFRMRRWVPRYLRWYLEAFRPPLPRIALDPLIPVEAP